MLSRERPRRCTMARAVLFLGRGGGCSEEGTAGCLGGLQKPEETAAGLPGHHCLAVAWHVQGLSRLFLGAQVGAQGEDWLSFPKRG